MRVDSRLTDTSDSWNEADWRDGNAVAASMVNPHARTTRVGRSRSTERRRCQCTAWTGILFTTTRVCRVHCRILANAQWSTEAGAGSRIRERLSPQTPRVNTDGVGDDRSGRRGRERAVSRMAQWRCVSRKLCEMVGPSVHGLLQQTTHGLPAVLAGRLQLVNELAIGPRWPTASIPFAKDVHRLH